MNDIVEFIRHHQRFLVTSHARPDGDSIGSSIAMTLALEALGKQVDLIHSDPPPTPYAGLTGIDRIQIRREVSADYDAAIVLECNDTDRPGLVGLEKNLIINIDHHHGNTSFGRMNFLDFKAAAAGEIVYRLVQALGVKPTADIANSVLVAIVSDTGAFQFSATSPETFRIAAELLEHGARPELVAESLFNSNPFAKIKLIGLVLSTIETDPAGRVAWVYMTEEMRKRAGAEAGDTEGVVNHALSIKGVLAAAFLREETPGNFRVSLRSKRNVDVSAVARTFGGGGHRNAAGCSIEGTLEPVRALIVEKLQIAVKNSSDG